MAYASVQSSGLLVADGSSVVLSWTPSAPTLNNLLTARVGAFKGSGVNWAPAASNFHDSSATPKYGTLDAHVNGSGSVPTYCGSAVWSFLVPSGLTLPIKEDTNQDDVVGIFNEWSGNVTTSIVDQANQANNGTASVTSATGPSITTGANAGLVLSSITPAGNPGSTTQNPVCTGTSFVQDAVENDSANHVPATFDHRTTSVVSATLNDAATWTGADGWTAAIASYNAAAGGSTTAWRTTPARFKLASANAFKDTPARLRLQAAVRWHDTFGRLALKSANVFRDTPQRFRLQVANQSWHDSHARLLLKSVNVFRDTPLRLGLQLQAAATRDSGVRFKLAGNPINGPLRIHPTNSRFFTNNGGRGILLVGAHTWNDVQDFCTAAHSAPAFDFNAYVAWLRQHGLNCTILWRQDMVRSVNYLYSGPTWYTDVDAQWPWARNGPGNASDGDLRFDLTTFNQPYFDRLLARAQQLHDNGIYAIIDVYDACNLGGNRSSTDAFPFTDNATGGLNNINSIDDGYTTGTVGVGSVTMTSANAITAAQDAFVQKLVDTLNGLDNIIWETCEEVNPGAKTYWAAHMIDHLHAYEATKPYQHPVGMGTTAFGDHDDTFCLNTNADWVAVAANPVPLANNSKVVFQDSDHNYCFGTGPPFSTVPAIWENLCAGAGALLNMDGYITSVTSGLVFTPSGTITNGIGTGSDTGWDPVRNQIGWARTLVGMLHDVALMTPQASKASTGYALLNAAAVGYAAIVYAPSGGSFTLDLSATTRSLNVYWFNPASLALSTAAPVTGGSTAQSFSTPWGSANDAVLVVQDPTAWSDTGTRFRLVTGNTRDTPSRFKLIGQKVADTPARVRVGAQGWRDTGARLRLLAGGYRDSQVRFQTQTLGTVWRTLATARLKLQLLAVPRDTFSRFLLQRQSTWRDSPVRLIVQTQHLGFRDSGMRLRLVSPADTGSPPLAGTATGSAAGAPPSGVAIPGGF